MSRGKFLSVAAAGVCAGWLCCLLSKLKAWRSMNGAAFPVQSAKAKSGGGVGRCSIRRGWFVSDLLWRARVNWFVLMYTGGGPSSALLRGVLAALLVAWFAAADWFVRGGSDTRAVPAWWLAWGRGARASVWKCERASRLRRVAAGVWAVLDRGWVCAAIWIAFLCAAVIMLAGLGGCAAGRGPGGEVVVGWDVASLPETAGQAIASGAKWFPEPWQSLGIGIGTLVGGGAVAAVGRKLGHSERDRADAHWDEATIRAGGVVGGSGARIGGAVGVGENAGRAGMGASAGF